MIRLKNRLTILLCSSALLSFGQNNDHYQNGKVEGIESIKVISDSTNKLIDTYENLEIEYTVWGCACPNWIQAKDVNDTTKNYLKLHFYIEPANNSLELPVSFDAFRHRLKVSGQFYEREDFPQGTSEMEEKMPKAKVFRYTKLEIIDRFLE